ncbi:MAG: apolipoprotein N-acyltransferase [Deltaproteobacteria bacterium]|nr:apolipoprotein N-acyltransferase [Deltaproteobacteria bacterium]
MAIGTRAIGTWSAGAIAPARARHALGRDAMPARLVAGASSAALYSLLFPPFDLGWLAPGVLAQLFWAIAGLRPLAAAALGLGWAVLATAGVAWWLPRMLGAYFGLGPVASTLGLAGIGLLTVGPFVATFAAWLAWRWRRRAPSALAVGAAWALVEFGRSYAPIRSPFGLLAYGAPEPLAQLADLAGPWGIGALLAGCAMALARVLREGASAPPARRALAGALAALGLAALYGHGRLAQRFDEGEPLRVAVVQGAVVKERGWDRHRAGANLERYLALTRAAMPARPALVLWPEFALDFYLAERSAPGAHLRAQLRALGVELVTGANHYEPADGRTRYYNSVFALGADGRVRGRYDKTQLVPFAESAPLGSRWVAADGPYTAGASLHPLPLRSARIGAFLCGEALFPEVPRALARAGAELLVNPSNDHWFQAPDGAEQQLRAARLRAIESRRWLLRPTTTGFSAVIDPHGRVVARSRFGGAEVLTAEVWRSHAVTPAQRAGDAPLGAALAIVLSSSARGARGARPARGGGPA